MEAKSINMTSLTNGMDKEEKEKERSKHTGLVLAGVNASWQPDPIVDTLRNITLNIQPGEFIGVVGSVGSGKVSDRKYFDDFNKQLKCL